MSVSAKYVPLVTELLDLNAYSRNKNAGEMKIFV